MSELLSKDDILEDNWSSGLIPTDYPECIIIYREEVFNAMEEYAKQEAIGFNEWAGKDGWRYQPDVMTATHKDPTILTKLSYGLWYKKGQSVGGIKSEKLYDLYQQSKTKQP